MNKDQILIEIQRLASIAGGKAPGSQRFQSETGITKSDWYPNYWLRWGDAVCEAGLARNKLTIAISTEVLIKKYIELIRELGRFPIEGDIRVKQKQDKTFPSHSAFGRLGSKAERVTQVLLYCKSHSDCADVVLFCNDVPLRKNSNESKNIITEDQSIGYVYLIKHGSRREYKIGKTINPVRREGEHRLQLPEKLQPIHYIETDDPSGIENYWQKRFADKRMGGEFFALSDSDVRAFKRWKRIY
jgi:Meiotically up-regulated gene 113